MLHRSYSFALAFKPSLATSLMERIGVNRKQILLDPFCGTGTTLLEAKLRGVASIGIDANPICVLVTKAKTQWTLDIEASRKIGGKIILDALEKYKKFQSRHRSFTRRGRRYSALSDQLFAESRIGAYLLSSGLIRRGWISPRPALKSILLAESIWQLPQESKNFLLLTLLGLLVPRISNMSYGPEIYRARTRKDCDVFSIFRERLDENLTSLELLKSKRPCGRIRVVLGSSVQKEITGVEPNSVDAIVTSPPYLSDHDYSRLTRLELIFAGHVLNKENLRSVKKRLLRSSSKNVFKGDNLTDRVARFPEVRNVIARISHKAKKHDSGFARVYPRLVGEYFGGMHLHFEGIGRVLRRGGKAAYVVGDQSSFFATRIPTARILAKLAERNACGLRVCGFEPVKKYHGTRGNVRWSNQEWAILLEKK